MPRWRSSSIQSEVVARWLLRAVTEPANWTAPPYKRNFSVKVVLPASGCEIIAKVRLREICFCINRCRYLCVKSVLKLFLPASTTRETGKVLRNCGAREGGRGGNLGWIEQRAGERAPGGGQPRVARR